MGFNSGLKGLLICSPETATCPYSETDELQVHQNFARIFLLYNEIHTLLQFFTYDWPSSISFGVLVMKSNIGQFYTYSIFSLNSLFYNTKNTRHKETKNYICVYFNLYF